MCGKSIYPSQRAKLAAPPGKDVVYTWPRFVTSGGGGLESCFRLFVVDVHDTASPQLAGGPAVRCLQPSLTPHFEGLDMVANAAHAYLASSADGLWGVNVTDPGAPYGDTQLTGGYHKIDWLGDQLVAVRWDVIDLSVVVDVIDVTFPPAPNVVTSLAMPPEDVASEAMSVRAV
ncbi:MAG: hypothetical protein ACOY3Y_09220, partial [Acidobacteriota bacterium]